MVLIAVATLLYLVNTNPAADDSNKATSDLPTLLDSMNSSVKDPYIITALVEESGNASAVTKNVENNIWITADDGASVLNFSSERTSADLNEADYNSVVSTLKSSGLTLSPGAAQPLGYSATDYVLQSFSSEFIACNLRNTPASNDTEGVKIPVTYALRVSCVNQADFNGNIDALSPFIGSYTGATDKDLVFRDLVVQDSGTPDYENAYLRVSDIDNNSLSVGLFYRKTDGDWRYFKMAEDKYEVACSEYDSEDLISAFVGVTCLDGSTDRSSFVDKPSPVVAPNPGDEPSGSGG